MNTQPSCLGSTSVRCCVRCNAPLGCRFVKTYSAGQLRQPRCKHAQSYATSLYATSLMFLVADDQPRRRFQDPLGCSSGRVDKLPACLAAMRGTGGRGRSFFRGSGEQTKLVQQRSSRQQTSCTERVSDGLIPAMRTVLTVCKLQVAHACTSLRLHVRHHRC
jgi:hypothetical protein